MLIVYFIAFIILDGILSFDTNIDPIITTSVLSIIFYINFQKDIYKYMQYFKRKEI